MNKDFLKNQAKRINRNLLISACLLLALSLLLIGCGGISAVKQLPKHISENKLAKLNSDTKFNDLHIKIKLSKVNKKPINVADSDTKLIVSKIGSKYLLVRVTSDYHRVMGTCKYFVGYLKEIDSSIQFDNSSVITSDIKNNLLPFMFDATETSIFYNEFKNLGLMIMSFLGIAFFLISLKLIIKLYFRIINYQFHPVYKNVSHYGNYEILEGCINKEVSNNDTIIHVNVIITENWILQSTIYGLNILNIEDIVWAYEAIYKHKQSFYGAGIVTPHTEVARTYSVIIKSRHPLLDTIKISTLHQFDLTEKNDYDVIEGKKRRDVLLHIFEYIEERNPKALFGYSSDLEQMWNENKADFICRAGFND